ncbi:MAG: hypothetical protein KGZ86_05165, partial [Candidatus Latescibacteria bacterium]|nr:hypothetical protein [Candidatus Latescibacterota bacterium]
PWWTRADTLAVDQELALWRDTISGYNVILDQSYPCPMSVPITLADTAPRSAHIEQLVKIANLQGFDYYVTQRPLKTEYTFGRKNDTIMTRDTFCYVKYIDSSDVIVTLQFDSIWTITFYPDTTIDTLATPAETTITYRTANITKTYYTPLEGENNYDYMASRYLELKKDSAALNYRFKHLSGFGTYIPDNALAPTISYIVLSKQTGQRDTFRYSPRADGKGLLNLKDKDSLYTLDLDEIIDIRIVLAASTVDNYVFLSQGMPDVLTKHNIPVTTNTATSTMSFTQTGLSHLYIEVIPSSALFYPDAQWKTTIWALPVRVNP